MQKIDEILEVSKLEELLEHIDNYEVLIEFNENRNIFDSKLLFEYEVLLSHKNKLQTFQEE